MDGDSGHAAMERGTATPPRPVGWLVAGAVVAAASLTGVVWFWPSAHGTHTTADSRFGLDLLVAAGYVLGIFIFSYGYERQNVVKAFLRCGLILVLPVYIAYVLGTYLPGSRMPVGTTRAPPLVPNVSLDPQENAKSLLRWVVILTVIFGALFAAFMVWAIMTIRPLPPVWH